MSGTVLSNNSLIAGLNQLDWLWQVFPPAPQLYILRPLAPSDLLAYALVFRAANKKPFTAWVSGRGRDGRRYKKVAHQDRNPMRKGFACINAPPLERPVFFTGKAILNRFFARCKPLKIILDLPKFTIYSCNWR